MRPPSPSSLWGQGADSVGVMSDHEIVCFHCGQAVGDPPRLNLVTDQEPCRACAERMLETLPGIFHAPYEANVATEDGVRPEVGQVGQVEPGQPDYDDADSI